MLRTDTQYKNLMAEVRGMREEVGRIDRDLSRDRADMEDFKVQMATMKEEIKQVRSAVAANSDKVRDKVTDALEPAVKSVDKLKDEIRKKKAIYIFKNGFVDWLKEKWFSQFRENNSENKKKGG